MGSALTKPMHYTDAVKDERPGRWAGHPLLLLCQKLSSCYRYQLDRAIIVCVCQCLSALPLCFAVQDQDQGVTHEIALAGSFYSLFEHSLLMVHWRVQLVALKIQKIQSVSILYFKV